MEQNHQSINLLSFDVEDYFHVSAFESFSTPDTWAERELRVECNTNKILDMLAEESVKATFFVLGWVAEACPSLLDRIVAEGHEVASHGYNHARVNRQGREEFRQDITRSKKLLEDLTGTRVIGYRAPSYSISEKTFWAFDELHQAGYLYDSSIFPIPHDLYGIREWPRFTVMAAREADGSWRPCQEPAEGQPSLVEVPITTLSLGGKNWPIAGGGYFRLFPYMFTSWGLRRINNLDKQPFVFYLHPWEFDPDQPRMQNTTLKSRFRHYLNLHRTEGRFRQLLIDFEFAPIAGALSLH